MTGPAEDFARAKALAETQGFEPSGAPIGYVLRIVCLADGSSTPLDGRYVRRWHPHTRHVGLPIIDAVAAVSGARVFDTHADALNYWAGVNRKHPTRPDGKPNRPMTAYTCEVLPVAPVAG